MPWIAAIAALGSSAIGAIQQSGAQNAQSVAVNNAVQQYTNLGVPPTQALQIVMQQYQNAGQLTPQLEQTFKQASSNLNGVQTNPQFSQAQMGALQQLQQMGSNGGETLADQANLNSTLNQVASKNQGMQQAILQNAQDRGQLGSGQSLSAQLQAAQGAENQAQQSGLDINAQAQNRALQAIMGAGQMGGQMQQQQYSQLANAAKAQDAINQFNTANQQNVSNQNTALQNYTNQYNLANQQNISNLNTSANNQANMYNSQMVQQNFNDQMAKAQGVGNAYLNQGNMYANQGQQNANSWGQIGQGAAQIGSGLQQQQNFNNWMSAAYPATNTAPTQSNPNSFVDYNDNGGWSSGMS